MGAGRDATSGPRVPRGRAEPYLVTDEHGIQHDVGALVTAVLDLRRYGPIHIASAIELEPEEHILVTATATAGLEAGITLAVRKLYGPAAARAFTAHCRALEATDPSERQPPGTRDRKRRRG